MFWNILDKLKYCCPSVRLSWDAQYCKSTVWIHASPQYDFLNKDVYSYWLYVMILYDDHKAAFLNSIGLHIFCSSPALTQCWAGTKMWELELRMFSFWPWAKHLSQKTKPWMCVKSLFKPLCHFMGGWYDDVKHMFMLPCSFGPIL